MHIEEGILWLNGIWFQKHVVLDSHNTLWKREILDSTFIVNETIIFKLRNGKGGVMCKLDIGKTYDHIIWSFL